MSFQVSAFEVSDRCWFLLRVIWSLGRGVPNGWCRMLSVSMFHMSCLSLKVNFLLVFFVDIAVCVEFLP